MEHAPECEFKEEYFPFTTPNFSPFNQNTFLSRNVIPDYFLFPHIGRMDDIWASYYLELRDFLLLTVRLQFIRKEMFMI